jgi:hypothetical protein
MGMELVWRRFGVQNDREWLLKVVQPGLTGLIDGTVSTLAPIFATAFLAGAHAAFFVGLAASFGAGISMGLSEALSDDGELTGRGAATQRGTITGTATAIGGSLHSLPFLIPNLSVAVPLALGVVACELLAISWLRRRFLRVPLTRSLVQVVAGGALVVMVGVAIGQS